jgi:uncharacterized protein YqjF (DUF2071 family)
MNATANPAANISQTARRWFLQREKRPLLTGDWTRAFFLHYEVPVDSLQPFVPFELDYWEGSAFVSAVAFSMESLRPCFGGAVGRWLFWPIPNHDFFNMRTYVRHGGVPGIFFMSEWLNNFWSVLCGPITYGLPYKFARIRYEHRDAQVTLSGRVGNDYGHTAEIATDVSLQFCAAGSLDEFLLERYTGFTKFGRRARYFDIWHEPWRQMPVDAHISDDRLLRHTFPWFAQARLAGAHYSPGVRDVWMGAPRALGQLEPQGFHERR